MAAEILTDFELFINKQVQLQEEIGFILSKLEATIAVIQGTDRSCHLPEYILHNYFSAVSDLAESAVNLNQRSVENLLRYLPGTIC